MISKQLFSDRFAECIKKVICIRNLSSKYPAFIFQDGAVKLSGSNNSFMENYKKIYITDNTKISDFFYSHTEILFSIHHYNSSHYKEFLMSENDFLLKQTVIENLKKMYKNDSKLYDVNEILYTDYYKTNYEMHIKNF